MIDVTAVNPNDYKVIRDCYRDYFLKQFFPMSGDLPFLRPSALEKLGEDFQVGPWPDLVLECVQWRPFRLVIRAQLIDFEPFSPRSFEKHIVWEQTPRRPNAQRVMWIQVYFEAKGLSGSGRWPEHQKQASTTKIAS